MAEESFEERTEAPTPKRRSEAREKGNVSKSTEVNSVLVLLAGAVLLRMFGRRMFLEIETMFRFFYRFPYESDISTETVMVFVYKALGTIASSVLPVVLGILMVGLAANVLQIGFLFTLKPLQPKMEKINPLSGLQRMFAVRSLVELAKNLLKLTIIGFIAYATIKDEFDAMLVLSGNSVGGIWLFLLDVGFKIIIRIALVLLVLSILDYAYQRYEHEKKLKMTRQEVKEEHKQMEGDPKVKGRIRSLQREMARRRMMQEVPQATVVVTNPTYIAIAIRYEAGEMETPFVLAKGKRAVAERIKKIATENRVPIVEDKPLARAMYDKVEIGEAIPFEFFTAVAEVLAYVYRLRNRNAA
ncbi:MAG: flagellar biosynthesis protein FlhB [Chitinivibrionales bacterium]|nr:flagellar biosynthesis protein FlhB [Chitinivibrionales bacterium]MBD3356723.1 flagellar biosynthesis protein FlhB [Chitinivibrionales bacterium]